MKQKKLLVFFIGLLLVTLVSCHDDDDDLIGLWEQQSTLDGKPRYGAAAFTIGTKGYIVGGYDDKDRFSDCWEYDMDRNTWTQRASLNNTFARSGGVSFAIGGKGYYGTGITDTQDINSLEDGTLEIEGMISGVNYSINGHLGDFWEYDPSTNIWTRKADFGGTPRYQSTAFAVNNKGYIGFGVDNEQGYVKDIYEYTPATDSWTKIDFIGEKCVGATAFVIDNVAYLVGGEDNGNLIYNFYKFEDGNWTKLRTITNDDDDDYDDDYTTIARVHGVAMVIDGYAYYTLGQQGTSGSLNQYTWKYDPRTDLWEEVRKFKKSARTRAVSFSNGGSLGYITTGKSSTYNFDDLWSFDPYTYDDDDF